MMMIQAIVGFTPLLSIISLSESYWWQCGCGKYGKYPWKLWKFIIISCSTFCGNLITAQFWLGRMKWIRYNWRCKQEGGVRVYVVVEVIIIFSGLVSCVYNINSKCLGQHTKTRAISSCMSELSLYLIHVFNWIILIVSNASNDWTRLIRANHYILYWTLDYDYALDGSTKRHSSRWNSFAIAFAVKCVIGMARKNCAHAVLQYLNFGRCQQKFFWLLLFGNGKWVFATCARLRSEIESIKFMIMCV